MAWRGCQSHAQAEKARKCGSECRRPRQSGRPCLVLPRSDQNSSGAVVSRHELHHVHFDVVVPFFFHHCVPEAVEEDVRLNAGPPSSSVPRSSSCGTSGRPSRSQSLRRPSRPRFARKAACPFGSQPSSRGSQCARAGLFLKSARRRPSAKSRALRGEAESPQRGTLHYIFTKSAKMYGCGRSEAERPEGAFVLEKSVQVLADLLQSALSSERID